MKKFFGIYFLIALTFSPFLWVFGEYNHKSYFYNLGQSLWWPKVIFSSSPKLDGSSISAFETSAIKVSESHPSADREGQGLFISTIGLFTLIEAAKVDRNFTMDDYKNSQLSSVLDKVKSKEIKTATIKRLDGLSFAGVTRKFESADAELRDLIKDRVKQSPQPTESKTSETTTGATPPAASASATSVNIDYSAKWVSTKNDPTQFLATCKTTEKTLAIKVAGMNEGAAETHANEACKSKLESLRMCMNKPSATAQNCFEDLEFQGD